jgi:glucose-6-phosphate 1-epimerase
MAGIVAHGWSRLAPMERLPDGALIETGPGGLERLTMAAAAGEAHVFLHGGHVTHFQPRGGKPVLWVSGESCYESGRPIRGGVPVCFPWFGPKAGAPEAPMHGFARTRPWSLRSVKPDANGTLRASLELGSDASTRTFFPHDLRATLEIVVGATLGLTLRVRNEGPSPFEYEEALHSYFAVADVRACRIRGLEGTGFVDKTAAGARLPAEGVPIAIAAETDRVYTGTEATVTIEDPGLARRLVVAKKGSRTTVVWNPWAAKAKAMSDFGDDEWPGMLCVETANAAADAVMLAPGASHTMTTTIEALPL